MAKRHYLFVSLGVALGGLVLGGITVYGHGTAVSPQSRVYKVYKSNPENPDFELAQNAVEMDGKSSYYTWNQVSRMAFIKSVECAANDLGVAWCKKRDHSPDQPLH